MSRAEKETARLIFVRPVSMPANVGDRAELYLKFNDDQERIVLLTNQQTLKLARDLLTLAVPANPSEKT